MRYKNKLIAAHITDIVLWFGLGVMVGYYI